MWGPKCEKVRKPWVLRLKRWILSIRVSDQILQQGDSQVSEPCHDKPVNGVAQRAGGWRTGTLLFRSARNRSFL